MTKNQQNRRSAAILCLIAFFMMFAISTVHTHVSSDTNLSTHLPAIGALRQTAADNCIACEMLLNNSSSFIFLAACLFMFFAVTAWVLQSITSAVCGITIYTSSPRAPPAI